MPADPISDGAVRQASVSLLAASGEVGDLGAIDHPLGHAVAWHRALPASTVAIATSGVLDVVATVDNYGRSKLTFRSTGAIHHRHCHH